MLQKYLQNAKICYTLEDAFEETGHVHAGAQQLEPEERHFEDASAAPRFQARIDADDRIEPNDWMPAAYRKP